MYQSTQFDIKIFEKSVIKCLLDELCLMTQSDSSWILPDMSFSADLEIQPEQVVALASVVCQKLGLNWSHQNLSQTFSIQTPKQFVEFIVSQYCRSVGSSTAA